MHKYIREDHKDQIGLAKNGRSFFVKLSLIFALVLLVLVLMIAILDKSELDKFLGYFFAFLGGTGFGGGAVEIIRKKANNDG